MRSWGIWLVVFGIGSFVLPMFGRQFALLGWIDEKILPVIGGILIVIGAVLVIVSFLKKKPAAAAAPAPEMQVPKSGDQKEGE